MTIRGRAVAAPRGLPAAGLAAAGGLAGDVGFEAEEGIGRAFYDDPSDILSHRGNPPAPPGSPSPIRAAMDTIGQVQKAIDAAVADVNLTLRKEETPLVSDPALILVGEGGRLDSLGLVNFVVALDRRLVELGGRSVSVIDLLTSGDAIPFDTLGSLRDLLVRKMES
jgi:hypothetical protein